MQNDQNRRAGRGAKQRGSGALWAMLALWAAVAVGAVWLLLGALPGRPAGQPAAPSYAQVEADSAYSSAGQDFSAYGSTVLAQTADAGQQYLDDTLFIGDSNTYRYWNYGFTALQNNIGIVGMGAGIAATEPCVKFRGMDYVTIPRAVGMLQPRRMIIGFGTNDLTGPVEQFIQNYSEAIHSMAQSYPYADVIVSAIPPVARQRSYTSVTMQQVDLFNEALVEMCHQNGWYFLNTSAALKDPATGFAREGYTVADGLHLSQEGCAALFDYIRTHALLTEDSRPLPLAAVPERQKTPENLITQDPLASQDTASWVVVTFTAGEGGSIQGQTEQTVAPGGACAAVTAQPAQGYRFAGWSCSMGSISAPADPTLVFTAPQGEESYGGVFVSASFAPLQEGQGEAASQEAGQGDLWGWLAPAASAQPGSEAQSGAAASGSTAASDVQSGAAASGSEAQSGAAEDAWLSGEPTAAASPQPGATATPTASPQPGSTATPTASPQPGSTATPTASPQPGSTATPAAQPEEDEQNTATDDGGLPDIQISAGDLADLLANTTAPRNQE